MANEGKTRGTRTGNWSSRPKYRIPGYWRIWELKVEINKRVLEPRGIGYDLSTVDGPRGSKAMNQWFCYLKRKGVIPDGSVRLPGMMQKMYTDLEMEQIITHLNASLDDNKSTTRQSE